MFVQGVFCVWTFFGSGTHHNPILSIKEKATTFGRKQGLKLSRYQNSLFSLSLSTAYVRGEDWSKIFIGANTRIRVHVI